MITINFTVVVLMRSSQGQQEKTESKSEQQEKLSKDELEAVQRGDELTGTSRLHKS